MAFCSNENKWKREQFAVFPVQFMRASLKSLTIVFNRRRLHVIQHPPRPPLLPNFRKVHLIWLCGANEGPFPPLAEDGAQKWRPRSARAGENGDGSLLSFSNNRRQRWRMNCSEDLSRIYFGSWQHWYCTFVCVLCFRNARQCAGRSSATARNQPERQWQPVKSCAGLAKSLKLVQYLWLSPKDRFLTTVRVA